jgi:5-methylcytosine rRNA methyltransferase NSUN4
MKKTKKSAAGKHAARVLAREKAKKEAFDLFYASWFGSQRWKSLETALRAPINYVCVINLFASERLLQQLEGLVTPSWMPEPQAIVCLEAPFVECSVADKKPFQPPFVVLETKLKSHYILDGASVLCAAALAPVEGNRILDMCSAPGGKAFCVLQALLGSVAKTIQRVPITLKNTILQANEVDATRRKRLASVLREYVPSTGAVRVEITAFDASKKGTFQYEHFDRVLLDAPCSAERHLIQNEKELLESWKKTRPQNHAKRQVALLTEGLRALAVGGRLVYATCALTETENDQVVKRTLERLKKRGKDSSIEIERSIYKIGEPTPMGGWMILPDTTGGYGPLYFVALKKKETFGEEKEDDVDGDGEDDADADADDNEDDDDNLHNSH